MTNHDADPALRLAAALAWASAALYALIALGLPYPDLGAQRAMFALAAAAYAVGGLLLWRGVGTRLLLVGAVANAAVIVIWLVRAASGASPADGFAIVTKILELALGAVIAWVLWTRMDRQARTRAGHLSD